MMSLADFLRHVKKEGCEYNPFEGGNITGNAVEITHKGNNTYYILNIYKDGMVSDTTIREACMIHLLINTPKKFT